MRIAISPDENPGDSGAIAANGTEAATLNGAGRPLVEHLTGRT